MSFTSKLGFVSANAIAAESSKSEPTAHARRLSKACQSKIQTNIPSVSKMTGSGAAAALMSTQAIHKAARIVFRLVASAFPVTIQSVLTFV